MNTLLFINDFLVASTGLLHLLERIFNRGKVTGRLSLTHLRLKKLLSGVQFALLRSKDAADVLVELPQSLRIQLLNVDFDLVVIRLAQALTLLADDLNDATLLFLRKFLQ